MDKTVLIPTPDQYQDWRSYAEALSQTLERMRSAGDEIAPAVFLADMRSSGINGGTFTAGAWQTRVLNSEEDVVGICLLNANEFTLPSGRYQFFGSAPANQAGNHQCRVWNVTLAAVALWGTSESGANMTTRSFFSGRVLLKQQSTFRIEHHCSMTRADDGFGHAAGLGQEVYTSVEIWGLN